jgi:hypothetical protein
MYPVTKCVKCKLVLADKRGRHHDHIFDSRVETPKWTELTTWALCVPCYDVLSERNELERAPMVFYRMVKK